MDQTYHQRYYQQNKKRIKAQAKAYYFKTKPSQQRYHHDYHAKHRNERRQRCKDWHNSHKESANEAARIKQHKRKLEAVMSFGGYCYECNECFLQCELYTREVQFDHVRGPKISQPLHTKKHDFWEEMAKCEPVHHDCHQQRTMNRRKLKLTLTESGWK